MSLSFLKLRLLRHNLQAVTSPFLVYSSTRFGKHIQSWNHISIITKYSLMPFCSHPLWPLPAPGNHWFGFCPDSFAFSTTSDKWNPIVSSRKGEILISNKEELFRAQMSRRHLKTDGAACAIKTAMDNGTCAEMLFNTDFRKWTPDNVTSVL